MALTSKHERGADVACRTDRAEHIGVGVTLILGLARTRPLLGPLIDEAVLLPDPHFVLEPDLDRQSGCYALAGDRLRHPLRKVFLKASIICGSCLGCCGRGLTCAKPSSLSARPIDTSSRSTSKRSLMTRLRSTHRHRTTPSVAGSGPASTIRFNSCFCSGDSFGRGPGALALISPSGPFSLYWCAQSHNVCRSMAPISAAALRLIPSSTAAAQWSATLGYEDVRAALALTLQPAQGAQFLAADGVNGRLTTLARRTWRRPVLKSTSPQRRLTSFAGPKGVTVGHQDRGRVAVSVTIVPSRSHQAFDFGFRHPRELIGKAFGTEVADVVAEVTDDKRLPKEQRKDIQAETAHKKTPRAKLLKLADKTINLRALVTSLRQNGLYVGRSNTSNGRAK
jgi:hypothetical protein